MLPRFSRHDPAYREFFREQGYTILSNIFSRSELETARNEVLELFALRAGASRAAFGLRELQELYERDLETFRSATTRMWDMLGIYGLASAGELHGVLRGVGLVTPIISTRPEVRTDMPGDKRYTQPWHQDWRFGQGSANAVTIWTPLGDTTVENGTVEVLPGTHLLGYLECREISDPRRFEIVDRRIESLQPVRVELRFGEALVFSQMLVHRSGHNRSGLPRLSTQQRFSDLRDESFAREGHPSPTTSEIVWSVPPDADTMRRIYGSGLSVPAG